MWANIESDRGESLINKKVEERRKINTVKGKE